MFDSLLSRINRHCPVCRVRIEGKGLRRGFRVFCSRAHRDIYTEQEKIEKRVLRWMGNKRVGGCCGATEQVGSAWDVRDHAGQGRGRR